MILNCGIKSNIPINIKANNRKRIIRNMITINNNISPKREKIEPALYQIVHPF